MKKVLLFLLLISLSISVSAATINVKSLDATVDSKTIKYSGEMEDGSHAVMCKLVNEKDEEVDYLSSAVDNSKFEGSFTVSKEGKYKVNCANYEGGDIKSVEVEVKSEETPNTLDKIYGYIGLLALSITAVIGLILYNKKNN